MSTESLLPFAHPALVAAWPAIKAEIEATGVRAEVISTYRTPVQQFELFKKGRTWDGDSWNKTGATVTNCDGYHILSRHNYLPSLAMDIALYKDGKYLQWGSDYGVLSGAAARVGLEWGGNWRSFKDYPHIQLFAKSLLGESEAREAGEQWQRYLVEKAKKDIGAVDGYVGGKTLKALQQVTSFNQVSPEAWQRLVEMFGALT